MADTGFVTLTCTRCKSPFVTEFLCSRHAGYVDHSNVLCSTCRFEVAKLESVENAKVTSCLMWASPPVAGELLREPGRELFEYIMKHPEMVYRLQPRRFERLVADILAGHGFEVELTPQTRDWGVDVVACRRDTVGGPAMYLVECKRVSPPSPVGLPVVQRLLGAVMSRGATKGLLVATTRFTAPARALERRHLYRLALHDYEDLKTWIRSLCERWSP